MKVLLINNRHFHGGGADVVYFTTGELLKSAGLEVQYFSRHSEKAESYDLDSWFAPDIDRFNAFKKTILYFNNKEASEALDRLLCHEKFDIAHVHLMWGGMTGAIIPILHKHGIPVVHTAHDYRMICPAYTFYNSKGEVCEQCKPGHYLPCIKNCCKKGSLLQSIIMAAEMNYRNRKWHPAKELDGILYVSNFAKQKHEEVVPLFANVPNTVIYNFTTIGEQYPTLEKDGGYYLYYGRLSFEKGIETLVDVFEKYPELQLKVVGTGPLDEDLKRKRIRNVKFIGFKSGQELYELVRKARFVCVPSEWYENNPMTIVEAYSLGVPVIGARIGGIPEIVIEGETGFLFTSGDKDSLEESINKSLAIGEESYNAMKYNASIFAKEHFNSKTYQSRIIHFYENVIQLFQDRLKENKLSRYDG